MKTKLSILLVACALCVPGVFGQATTSSTTLGAAVGQFDTVVKVASATGITAAGTLGQTTVSLFVDREEMPRRLR